MKRILVLCTGNSCRSQMAHGYLRHFGPPHTEVFSAGVETHGVNPKAVKVMALDGIDISSHTSNHIDEYQGMDFDYVITVCDHARERCPWFPGGALKLHQNFPDPAKAAGSEKEILDAFIHTRDLIKDYCRDFSKKYLHLKRQP